MGKTRLQFHNRYTGTAPTREEWDRIKTRAHHILANPYAAPELLEWAMEVLPCEIGSWQWQNIHSR